MISSARPTSRRNTRPDALANKTSSVSPHAHGGRMTLFPWINPITREAPYSRESRSSCKHTCAVTAQTPKFRRRITGGTPGNVKLLLPPRQSRGNSQYISNEQPSLANTTFLVTAQVLRLRAQVGQNFGYCGSVKRRPPMNFGANRTRMAFSDPYLGSDHYFVFSP